MEVDKNLGILRARFYGRLIRSDACQGIASIRKIVAGGPVDAVLVDVRELQRTPSDEDVRQCAAEFVKFMGRRPVAILVRYLVHYGVARRLAYYATAQDIEVRVFDHEPSALSWLDARRHRSN